MSRLRQIKRNMRGSLHREMSVPALFIFASADPVPCNVRVWAKNDAPPLGDLPGNSFSPAVRAEPEDRLRFDLAEVTPKRLAVVSVESGEAYRIDHLYTRDDQYQTARVTRLSASEAAGLPLPTP